MADTAEKNGQYITYNLENAYYIAAALCTYGAGWNVSYTESGAVESITSNFSGEEGYKAAATIMHWVQDYEDTLTTAENTQEAPCNDNEDILGCVNGAWSVASSDGGVSSYAVDEVSWRLNPAMNYEGEVADTKTFTASKAFGVNPNKSSGDYLEVTAPGVSWNNTYQFYMDQSTISWITDVQPAFTLPEPTALTAEIAESWTSGEIPVTELKEYTWTATAGLSGTYNTLNVEGSDVSIQPVYLDNNVWTIETGTTYDVTAYFVGYYGYASIVLTALEAAD